MPLNSATSAAAASSVWVALAPHDGIHGKWHFYSGADTTSAAMEGSLSVAVSRIGHSAVTVVAPLSRCIIMAADLPLLAGTKLRQALAGALGDRLSGGGAQHYAAAPADNGRIREVAICDAAWLRQCLASLNAAGLRVARVIPEAAMLPKGAAWWGRFESHQPPAWLLRSANGEAVRVAPPLLDAVLPATSGEQTKWQWLADDTCAAPSARDGVTPAMLSAAALLRRGAQHLWGGWDLLQFDFAPPDGAARVLRWGADALRQRSGRLALGALLALLAVNLLGLNLYAMKQRREISARHAEMERIATQALPGVPRVLEPALQLEAAWQRTRGGAEASSAGVLLGLFAQSGGAQAVTTLEVSARTLRAGYADAAALDRSWTACQGAALREVLQRAGVRCSRDGGRLLLDFAGNEAGSGTPASPKG